MIENIIRHVAKSKGPMDKKSYKCQVWYILQAALFGLLISANFIFVFGIESAFLVLKRLYGESILFLLYSHLTLYFAVYAIINTFNVKVP